MHVAPFLGQPDRLATLIRYRTFAVYLFYGCVSALSLLAASSLYAGGIERVLVAPAVLALFALVRGAVAAFTPLTARRWRFVGTEDLAQLLKATLGGTLLLLLLVRFLPAALQPPGAVLALESAFTVFLTAGVWVLYRLGYETMHGSARALDMRRRVIIVGAGEAGNLLAREMNRTGLGYRLLAFVDDDATRWGTYMRGTPVLGPSTELPRIASQLSADEILLAVPSASPDELRRIVDACKGTLLPFRILPGIAQVLEGRIAMNQLRDVEVDDLLGRLPVSLELPELSQDLAGRTVLVTGAAGSIGSELTRQLMSNSPDTVIAFDAAESPLFLLDLDLRHRFPNVKLVPIVGDVRDVRALENVFSEYPISRVYHAAAYKHVPMMEGNSREAFRNNVLGTLRLAQAAARFGVEKFVLISTDKAVRPSNVMGATKRLAELMLLELQRLHPETSFTAVRFGNVLGSNGSVIPVFRSQLQQRRALTVTHPDATRYFMTIPEAVQLVLQTSLLPDAAGRIAMLDMGSPVRIMELAENLVRLLGLRLGRDVHIEIVGLRPGEKLHEELSLPSEQLIPTAVAKVALLRGSAAVSDTVTRAVTKLAERLDDLTEAQVRQRMFSLLPEDDRINLELIEEELPADRRSAKLFAAPITRTA